MTVSQCKVSHFEKKTTLLEIRNTKSGVYFCMRACMRAYLSVCMHVCVHVRMYVCVVCVEGQGGGLGWVVRRCGELRCCVAWCCEMICDVV